jgi:hypothetical protein
MQASCASCPGIFAGGGGNERTKSKGKRKMKEALKKLIKIRIPSKSNHMD